MSQSNHQQIERVRALLSAAENVLSPENSRAAEYKECLLQIKQQIQEVSPAVTAMESKDSFVSKASSDPVLLQQKEELTASIAAQNSTIALLSARMRQIQQLIDTTS
jgi:hypothetical protein